MSVTFPAPQTAADMNVVVVGWNDTNATVQSLKDSAGNSYSLAVGPTSGSSLRQSIYYAPNIAGGNNTVTVAFSQSASYPDVRVLEYRGVTALDVTAGASGNSSSASSGAATTRSANELIVGADTVYTSTASAGSGFTSRLITQDGDIAEDKIVTATGSNSATGTLSSSGNWVMQMATFSPTAIPDSPAISQLTVSPASLAFGNVTVGSTSTLPVTLTSTGTSAVTINSATVSGTGFTVSGATFPLTLSPQQKVTLNVVSAPLTTGAATGVLTVSSSSTSPTTKISLSSTGVAATTTQLGISTTSLSFGNVAMGSSSTLPLTVTSTGTAPLTVNSAAVSGTGFTVLGATFPMTLNPAQAVTFNVKFAPTTANAATGTLMIGSNAARHTSTAVSLSGTGTNTNTAAWTMSSTSLSFGSVGVGSSSTQSVTVTSTGTSALTINSATISGTGFTVSGATFPMTLNPKQTVTLSVKFAPTAVGAATGTLTVNSNASTNPTVPVSLSGTGTGTSTLTVSPTSLSFGDVTVGSNATLGVTLTSSGTSSVTVNSAAISGTGFTVSGATFPVTLSPSQAVTLQVKFAPTAASTVTGTLTISSTSSTGSTVSVGLSGTGTSHQVSLTWQAPSSSSDPVAGYHIYRATGSSSSYTLLNSSVVTQTSYVDTTVVGSTSYTYYVKSVDASGNESGPSNSVSVTIPSP